MNRAKDLAGKKFGRLVVLYDTNLKKNGVTLWHCVCECGNEIDVRASCLTTNHTKSCGCLQKEKSGRKPVHNETHSRLYGIWRGMKDRCYRKEAHNYYLYGGRGITVCNEWLNSYENFKNWAIENGYNSNLSIDRIDGNRNYCPSNCRWATNKEQQNNIITNHYIEANGMRMTTCQWAEYLGVNHKTLETRIHRGWSDEKIINTPIRKKVNR